MFFLRSVPSSQYHRICFSSSFDQLWMVWPRVPLASQLPHEQYPFSVCLPPIQARGDTGYLHPSATDLHLAHILQRSYHLWMILFINKVQSAHFLTGAPGFLHLKCFPGSLVAFFGDCKVSWGIDSTMIGMCLDGYTPEEVELMENVCFFLPPILLYVWAGADWIFIFLLSYQTDSCGQRRSCHSVITSLMKTFKLRYKFWKMNMRLIEE